MGGRQHSVTALTAGGFHLALAQGELGQNRKEGLQALSKATVGPLGDWFFKRNGQEITRNEKNLTSRSLRKLPVGAGKGGRFGLREISLSKSCATEIRYALARRKMGVVLLLAKCGGGLRHSRSGVFETGGEDFGRKSTKIKNPHQKKKNQKQKTGRWDVGGFGKRNSIWCFKAAAVSLHSRQKGAVKKSRGAATRDTAWPKENPKRCFIS